MNRRPTRGSIRGRASGSFVASKSVWNKMDENPKVYIGPTVEGPDAEYIKVVSGKVDVRKPSFV